MSKSIIKEVKVDVNFSSVSPESVRFKLDCDKLISSNTMDLLREVLPADYEASKYDVIGSMVITIKATPKK